MICAWQEYLKILPHWMRADVDKHGREKLQEIRMRVGQPPKLNLGLESISLERNISGEDVAYVVNVASKYSPWAASTIAKGYITAPGGHRIGICGDAVIREGILTGIRTISSICVRVARDFLGISSTICNKPGSYLIIGPPGSGKTTLLRDMIRQRSNQIPGNIAVLDERGEIFPVADGISYYPTGSNTDILTGCSKKQGIELLLRTMGPICIAVDEITQEEDCDALVKAGWCGVSLIATAHAACTLDLYTRQIYKPLMENHLFDYLIILQSDKTWTAERIDV